MLCKLRVDRGGVFGWQAARGRGEEAAAAAGEAEEQLASQQQRAEEAARQLSEAEQKLTMREDTLQELTLENQRLQVIYPYTKWQKSEKHTVHIKGNMSRHGIHPLCADIWNIFYG